MIIKKILVAVCPPLAIRLIFYLSVRIDEKRYNPNVVYVKSFFGVAALVIQICGVFLLCMICLFADWEKNKAVWVGLSMVYAFFMLAAFFAMIWSLNWKIDYDMDGFQYRTMFRHVYSFKHTDVMFISRKRDRIRLHTNKMTISLDKMYYVNLHPFMVVLTDKLSKQQCRSTALKKKRNKKRI